MLEEKAGLVFGWIKTVTDAIPTMNHMTSESFMFNGRNSMKKVKKENACRSRLSKFELHYFEGNFSLS